MLAVRAADTKLGEYVDTLGPVTGGGDNDEHDDGDGGVGESCSTSAEPGPNAFSTELLDKELLGNGEEEDALVSSTAVCDIMHPDKKVSLTAATQPDMITGIQMKKYQLQALQWMIDRERDVSAEFKERNQRETLLGSSVSSRDESVVINLEEDGSDDGEDLAGVDFVTPPPCSAVTTEAYRSICLPIEGVLNAPDVARSLGYSIDLSVNEAEEAQEEAQSSLWKPIFALQVLSKSISSLSKSVNFYSKEDIMEILAEQEKTATDSGAVKVLWWNRYTQSVSSVPPPRITACRGGILADQM